MIRSTVGALVVACLCATPARAAPDDTPILVVEAHVGPRPKTADRVMAPLRTELERRGFAARPETIGKLAGSRVPRPGILDRGKTAAEIMQVADRGYEAFTSAKFAQAVSTLTDAIEQIHRNPALLVLDTSHAAGVVKAYVALALSQSKLGQTSEAAATMTELIRMVRAQPISRAEHGPQAELFARAVYAQVAGLGRGRLTIDTRSTKAMIFVDRQIRGVGTAALADLIPGVYQVLVQEPGTVGRQYAIEVTAGAERALEVPWEVDSALTISEPWIGFSFLNEAARAQEGAFAVSLGRRWTGRAVVAVVGTTQLQGRPALIGTLYASTGKVLRSAVIHLDGADDAVLRSLARFLANGTPSDGITIIDRAQPALARAPRETGWVPIALVVGGAAAALGGATLIAIDEDLAPVGPQRPRYRDTAALGFSFAATGAAAAIGAGVWMWLRRGRREAAPTVSIGASSAVLGWTSSF